MMTIDPKINIYHDCNDGITASFPHSDQTNFRALFCVFFMIVMPFLDYR